MNKIKFAHLADLHLGGHKDNYLRELNFKTFEISIDKIIKNKVDFCIFAGDIFDTFMPSVEIIEQAVKQFMRLKNNKIPLYIIGGSHDYSLSQKSFLDVLNLTKIFKDFSRYKICEKTKKCKLEIFQDEKTGTIISGILGKKNGLDKNIYKNLDKLELNKDDLKIFMFHTSLNDFKPKNLEKINFEIKKNFLPIGFNYYAGGHIHTPMIGNYSGGIISYSGVLFPNNFSEFIQENPGFNLVEFDKISKKIKIERIEIKNYEKIFIKIDVNNLLPIEANIKIKKIIYENNIENKILLLKIFGIIKGKIIDVKINEIITNLYNLKVNYVLKNTYNLKSENLENLEIFDESEDKKIIEEKILNEVLNDDKKGKKIIKEIFEKDFEKLEEERVSDYEKRVEKIFDNIIKNDF